MLSRINSLITGIANKEKQDREQAQQTATRPNIYVIPRLHKELIDNPDNKYLIIKGGRGGFKTTSFICTMIEESYRYRNCGFMFTREIARSIKESVYSVVVDLIEQAGKSGDFTIKADSILNKQTNVKFIFSGLRATGGQTAMSQLNKLKGLHKIRMVFFEEGQDLTEDSLNVFLATINREGTVKLVDQDESTIADWSDTRFFVAMNPNKDIDPVVSKFRPYVESGQGQVAHVNMEDIVDDEPDFKDDKLHNQMELERGEWFFDHVWLGAPFHLFDGKPFSEHEVIQGGDIEQVHIAFLDPSFKGRDFTALCFLATLQDGSAVAFGTMWKKAWNMEPCFSEIVELIKRYQPTSFYYEENSLGTVPEDKFGESGVNAIGHLSMTNKENRIYKAAAFTKNTIKLDESKCSSNWLEQIIDYSNDSKNDDAADSYASAIIKSGIIRDRLKF